MGNTESQMRRTTDQHESADIGGEEPTMTLWLISSILVREIRLSAGPKSTLSVKVAIGAETASSGQGEHRILTLLSWRTLLSRFLTMARWRLYSPLARLLSWQGMPTHRAMHCSRAGHESKKK